MILSFLQQLYLFFSEDNLAELAREANEKSVGAVNYGSKYDCDEILERLDKRWEALEKSVDSAGDPEKAPRRCWRTKRNSVMMKTRCRFRHRSRRCLRSTRTVSCVEKRR